MILAAIGAVGTVLAWVIIVTALVCVTIYYVLKCNRLPNTGYDYDQVKGVGDKLKEGQEVILHGITNIRLFKAFLIELEFIHNGLRPRITYKPPHQHCEVYTIKLLENDYKATSELTEV